MAPRPRVTQQEKAKKSAIVAKYASYGEDALAHQIEIPVHHYDEEQHSHQIGYERSLIALGQRWALPKVEVLEGYTGIGQPPQDPQASDQKTEESAPFLSQNTPRTATVAAQAHIVDGSRAVRAWKKSAGSGERVLTFTLKNFLDLTNPFTDDGAYLAQQTQGLIFEAVNFLRKELIQSRKGTLSAADTQLLYEHSLRVLRHALGKSKSIQLPLSTADFQTLIDPSTSSGVLLAKAKTEREDVREAISFLNQYLVISPQKTRDHGIHFLYAQSLQIISETIGESIQQPFTQADFEALIAPGSSLDIFLTHNPHDRERHEAVTFLTWYFAQQKLQKLKKLLNVSEEFYSANYHSAAHGPLGRAYANFRDAKVQRPLTPQIHEKLSQQQYQQLSGAELQQVYDHGLLMLGQSLDKPFFAADFERLVDPKSQHGAYWAMLTEGGNIAITQKNKPIIEDSDKHVFLSPAKDKDDNSSLTDSSDDDSQHKKDDSSSTDSSIPTRASITVDAVYVARGNPHVQQVMDFLNWCFVIYPQELNENYEQYLALKDKDPLQASMILLDLENTEDYTPEDIESAFDRNMFLLRRESEWPVFTLPEASEIPKILGTATGKVDETFTSRAEILIDAATFLENDLVVKPQRDAAIECYVDYLNKMSERPTNLFQACLVMLGFSAETTNVTSEDISERLENYRLFLSSKIKPSCEENRKHIRIQNTLMAAADFLEQNPNAAEYLSQYQKAKTLLGLDDHQIEVADEVEKAAAKKEAGLPLTNDDNAQENVSAENIAQAKVFLTTDVNTFIAARKRAKKVAKLSNKAHENLQTVPEIAVFMQQLSQQMTTLQAEIKELKVRNASLALNPREYTSGDIEDLDEDIVKYQQKIDTIREKLSGFKFYEFSAADQEFIAKHKPEIDSVVKKNENEVFTLKTQQQKLSADLDFLYDQAKIAEIELKVLNNEKKIKAFIHELEHALRGLTDEAGNLQDGKFTKFLKDVSWWERYARSFAVEEVTTKERGLLKKYREQGDIYGSEFARGVSVVSDAITSSKKMLLTNMAAFFEGLSFLSDVCKLLQLETKISHEASRLDQTIKGIEKKLAKVDEKTQTIILNNRQQKITVEDMLRDMQSCMQSIEDTKRRIDSVVEVKNVTPLDGQVDAVVEVKNITLTEGQVDAVVKVKNVTPAKGQVDSAVEVKNVTLTEEQKELLTRCEASKSLQLRERANDIRASTNQIAIWGNKKQLFETSLNSQKKALEDILEACEAQWTAKARQNVVNYKDRFFQLFADDNRQDSARNFLTIIKAVSGYSARERIAILLEYVKREKAYVFNDHVHGSVAGWIGFTESRLYNILKQEEKNLTDLSAQAKAENQTQSVVPSFAVTELEKILKDKSYNFNHIEKLVQEETNQEQPDQQQQQEQHQEQPDQQQQIPHNPQLEEERERQWQIMLRDRLQYATLLGLSVEDANDMAKIRQAAESNRHALVHVDTSTLIDEEDSFGIESLFAEEHKVPLQVTLEEIAKAELFLIQHCENGILLQAKQDSNGRFAKALSFYQVLFDHDEKKYISLSGKNIKATNNKLSELDKRLTVALDSTCFTDKTFNPHESTIDASEAGKEEFDKLLDNIRKPATILEKSFLDEIASMWYEINMIDAKIDQFVAQYLTAEKIQKDNVALKNFETCGITEIEKDVQNIYIMNQSAQDLIQNVQKQVGESKEKLGKIVAAINSNRSNQSSSSSVTVSPNWLKKRQPIVVSTHSASSKASSSSYSNTK